MIYNKMMTQIEAMPRSATYGTGDSSGVVVVCAGGTGPLASVVSVWYLVCQRWTGWVTWLSLSLIQFVNICNINMVN